MLPTPKRLEVAVTILERIDDRRRSSGDPALGALLEQRIIQRELDLLEAEWLGRTTPRSRPASGRNTSLFRRWFGGGSRTAPGSAG